MTVSVGGIDKRIGLALSGGGFRAAAFHLGTFRALHERGLLWKLDLLTCVSGGSIAGAFLAAHWARTRRSTASSITCAPARSPSPR